MYSFRLFGRFQASWRGVRLDGFESRKVRELICYLLMYRQRPHSRELLAELLWEEADAATCKKNMRQTLWQLQSALPCDDGDMPVVLVDGDFLSINGDVPLDLDIEQFETVVLAVKDQSGYDLSPELAERIRGAVDLYTADFLEGWYVDWCLYERERFHNLYLILLDKLIYYYESQGGYESAIQYAMLALREDYAREQTHRELMRLYYLSGQRTTALRQYERCKQVLWEALQVHPSPFTTALYDRICAGDPAGPLFVPSPRNRDDTILAEIFNALAELRATLRSVQIHVQKGLDQDRVSSDRS